MRLNLYAACFLLLPPIGCGSSDDETEPVSDAEPSADVDPPDEDNPPSEPEDEPEDDGPFAELYRQGIDRYLGLFTPTAADPLTNGVTNHTFDVSDDGPLCFTGEPFDMTTRDGDGTKLMIFMQGGGVCSESACEAFESTTPIPPLGILSPATPDNPTADYDVGYLPYCDGTFFAGDRDVDSDDDGVDARFFRGQQNLSASLDVIAERYPSPSKILLIGNSAGGFGTHYALALVRRLYPDAPIDLINDSGMGIQMPGGLDALVAYHGSEAFFPESCEDCIGDDGNLTNYYKYQLDADTNLRMALIGSTQDETFVQAFPLGAEAFEEEVRTMMAELNDAHPVRFGSLINDGDEHTFVLRRFSFEIAGTTVQQSENWVSRVDCGANLHR